MTNFSPQDQKKIAEVLKETSALIKYAQTGYYKKMVAFENGWKPHTELQEAFYQMGLRLLSWAETLSRLTHPACTSGCCSCARGMLEIYWDAEWLRLNPSIANRYTNYDAVLRYVRAEQMIKDANPQPAPGATIIPAPKFKVSAPVAAYWADTTLRDADKKIVDTIYATGDKKHWCGLSYFQIAERLKENLEYHRAYKYMSTNIHSGPLGRFAKEVQQVVKMFCLAHMICHDYFVRSRDIIFKELGV